MKRKVVINPLGEIVINGTLESGSVNITELERVLGRKAQQRDFTREFTKQAKAALTTREWPLYVQFTRDSKRATSLVRFYVMDSKVLMVTEFIAFVDDRDAWRRIREFANKATMKMRTMIEMPHMDKSSMDNGKTWQQGPNHGRPERQVEVYRDVTGWTTAQVVAGKRAIYKLAKQTKADECWVSVI